MCQILTFVLFIIINVRVEKLTVEVCVVHQKHHILGCCPRLLSQVKHGAVAALRDVVDEVYQLSCGFWGF